MSEPFLAQTGRILTDPVSGRQVEVIYALPPQLAPPGESPDRSSDFVGPLLAHWGRIAMVAALFAALGMAYAFSKPNVYTASATALLPEKGEGLFGQFSGLAAAASISLPSFPTSSADAVVAILNSRHLREPLIDRFDLQAYYQTKTRDDALRTFGNDFSVKHDKRANTITITYTHRDPQVAAAVTNAAADLLFQIHSDITQNSARRTRIFLEERVRATEAELAQAARELAQFQAERGTVEIESQTNATTDALARLQSELNGQLIELKAALAAAAASANLQVQLIQQRIAATQAEMQRLLFAGDGLLLAPTRMPQNNAFVERYQALKKHEAILQALTTQLVAARMNEVRSTEPVTIIDRAAVPDRKSGPKRALICIIASMLGAVVGGCWVWLTHRRSLKAAP